MLKMPRKMAVLGAMLAALLITGAALAQQTPPHQFYGFGDSVTIDGEPAPSGTTIMAMAGGESVGSATYSAENGWSINDVPAGTMGVTFTVNGIATEGSYDTSAGGSTRLTLAVTSATEESDELEDDGNGDSGTMMDDGDDASGGTSDELEDGGDGGTSMDSEDGNGDGADDGSAGDGTSVEPLDEEPPTDAMEGDADDAMGGDTDDAMGDEDDAMDGDEAMGEGDNDFPDTGTGGLADSSRGVSSAVYGGIAGALALIALAGGVAVRRRAQS